ncbi:hypothetical protein, partial [Xiamenia xianingshaonis]
MTPAAALSQAALEATPAYADAITNGTITTPAQDLADWTEWKAGGDYNSGYATSIARVNVTNQADLVYSGDTLTPTFEVIIKVAKTDGTGNPAYYTLANTMYDATANSADVKNAGNYTYTFSFEGEGAPALAGGNELVVSVAKATATVTLVQGTVGVSTADALREATSVELSVEEDNVLSKANVTYGTESVEGAKLASASTDPYAAPGVVPVTIQMTNANATNYDVVVAGSTTPLEGKKGDNTVFTTTTSIVEATDYKVELDDRSAADGVKAVNNGTALDVPYKGSARGEAVKSAIKVTQGAEGPSVTWTPIYLNADNSPVVDSKGKPTSPTMPGKYKVQVKVGNQVLKTVPFTVYVDLSTMVKTGDGDTAPTHVMTVQVDGRWPNEVKLKAEENMTSAKAIAQIEKGMAITLKDADKPVPFEGNFKLISNSFTEGENAGGTATMMPASEGSAYRGTLPVTYSYGKALPAVELVKDSKPYNGDTGYTLEELISFKVPTSEIPGNDDYVIVATLMENGKPALNDDGDPIVVKGENGDKQAIKNAGTYQIKVVSQGQDYVGESDPMTFAITPLEVTTGKNANSTITYANPTLSTTATGGLTTQFTGAPIKPVPTVEVGDKELVRQTDPTSEDPYDYTVTYGDNTTVAEGGTITYKFSGNYSGEFTVPFAITPSSLQTLKATAEADNQLTADFDGKVLNPVVSYTVGTGDGAKEVVLEEGVDYTVEGPTKAKDQSDLDQGETRYSFTVKGMGNYSDAVSAVVYGEFLVTNKTIESLYTATVAEGSLYDPLKPVEPTVTVVQKGTTDPAPAGTYKVTFENNENATTKDAPAYAVVTGKGDYAGSFKVPFQIAPLELSDASNVKGSVKLVGAEGLVYNGKEQVPTVSIKDSKVTPVNKGYSKGAIDLKNIADDVTFGVEGGVNAGTSYVTIVPKNGNFTGQVKVPYEIAPAELAADNVAVAGSTAPGADAAVS